MGDIFGQSGALEHANNRPDTRPSVPEKIGNDLGVAFDPESNDSGKCGLKPPHPLSQGTLIRL